jgi:hypothetical protein
MTEHWAKVGLTVALNRSGANVSISSAAVSKRQFMFNGKARV